jgi:RNA polymerase sigma factor (sigma-70 family)
LIGVELEPPAVVRSAASVDDLPSMRDASDRDDYELLRAGEIGRLLAKYEPAVMARCTAKVRPYADAEDVAQNVMLRIYKEFNRGKRWNDQPFRVVIHQVIGWTINDYFQGRRYTDPLPEDRDAGNPGWTDEVHERDYLMELFSQLTQDEREIAELYLFEDLGGEEIARRVGKNRNAVDQAVFRIKRKFRELVSDRDG